MITAKEFLKKHAPCSTEGFMIEFAKMHVKAALKEASKEAQAGSQYSHHTGEFEDIPVLYTLCSKKFYPKLIPRIKY